MLESGYVYNSLSRALEHYTQQPPDYNYSTPGTKETLLEDLSECSFGYWDGELWQPAWNEALKKLPRMIKMIFKFSDEDKTQEFVVKIPVSK